MSGEIKLKATFHRPVYQVMQNPQQAYILLEALPYGREKGVETQAVNFSLVLDRSGSMAGEKLRQMKVAAKHIVNLLKEDDILSIIVFDDTADLVIEAAPARDKDNIINGIDAILERGGTHMSTGMGAALKELKREKSPNRVNGMLILTDGQTWEDQEECKSLADNCTEAGIPIHIMGLGVGDENNWDPRLLEEIAERSGGEWILVDDPKKVSSVFENTLLSLKGTAVSNAFLTLRLAEGVNPRTVWRITPLISRLGHRAISEHDVQVHLGDIQHGDGQSILADLLLPERKSGTYRFIQADIKYDVPESGLIGEQTSLDIITKFSDDPAAGSETDQRVMNIIERVTAHKLQTQALDDAAQGDSDRATQRLRAAATRLLELGENDLAEQANQQANQLEQGGQINRETDQRMRYATKKLNLTDRET